MKISVLGSNIFPISYAVAVDKITNWSLAGESRSVYAANVHMLMEAHDSPDFQSIVNSADLVTPDGMPLVWIMHHKGYPDQERVYGPTLMLKLVDASAKEGIPVGFLGATTDVMQKLTGNMTSRFPGLIVGTQIAPPFRPLNSEEDLELIQEINCSGIGILFVSLGCPKQEKWIAEHRGKIQAVMVGVGAAFGFHSGTLRQSPAWMQKVGLEWLFRLTQEPLRLWKRYLLLNPRFSILALRELFLEKVGSRRR